MPRAAAEFRQRRNERDEIEDSLDFNTWYHVDDMKRVIWKQYTQLDAEKKKLTLQPFIFFDGFDNLTLERMLSPLIKKLKRSPQLYFPFVFKPERASIHYIAGFLRKNADNTVSIVLFNPTGTTPRMDYGNYDYKLSLWKLHDNEPDSDWAAAGQDTTGDRTRASSNSWGDDSDFDGQQAPGLDDADALDDPWGDDDSPPDGTPDLFSDSWGDDSEPAWPEDMEKNTLYFKLNGKTLEYAVISPDGNQKFNASFNEQQLNALGIVLDFNTPLTGEIIRTQIKPKLPQILQITRARNHTEKKIEIISSPTPVQTHAKDGNRLVSCGPLTLDFVDYAMAHPEYMESVDEQFALPDRLDEIANDNEADYRMAVIRLRRQHHQILNLINDETLGSSVIDDSYREVTVALLSPELDDRADVIFIRSEIARFRANETCFFSINNKMKADKIEQALLNAMAGNAIDVRNDPQVKEALAIHRIFGFFGFKSTTATLHLNESVATTRLNPSN